jgi:D-alanyl-D-alanine carboxypeptidase
MQQLLSNIKRHRRAIFIVLFTIFLIVSYQSFQDRPAPIVEPVAIFSEYDFSAKAVYILDKKTGEVIHSENSSEVLEIASITGLPVCL